MTTEADIRLRLAKQEYGRLKLAQLIAIAHERYGTYAYPLAYGIRAENNIRTDIDRSKKVWLILLSQPIESNQPKIDRIREQRAILRKQFPQFYRNR